MSLSDDGGREGEEACRLPESVIDYGNLDSFKEMEAYFDIRHDCLTQRLALAMHDVDLPPSVTVDTLKRALDNTVRGSIARQRNRELAAAAAEDEAVRFPPEQHRSREQKVNDRMHSGCEYLAAKAVMQYAVRRSRKLYADMEKCACGCTPIAVMSAMSARPRPADAECVVARDAKRVVGGAPKEEAEGPDDRAGCDRCRVRGNSVRDALTLTSDALMGCVRYDLECAGAGVGNLLTHLMRADLGPYIRRGTDSIRVRLKSAMLSYVTGSGRLDELQFDAAIDRAMCGDAAIRVNVPWLVERARKRDSDIGGLNDWCVEISRLLATKFRAEAADAVARGRCHVLGSAGIVPLRLCVDSNETRLRRWTEPKPDPEPALPSAGIPGIRYDVPVRATLAFKCQPTAGRGPARACKK